MAAELVGPLSHIKAVSGEPTVASWSFSPSCQLRGHEDHGFDFIDVDTEARRGTVTLLGVLSLATSARTQQHRILTALQCSVHADEQR